MIDLIGTGRIQWVVDKTHVLSFGERLGFAKWVILDANH